jgi:hypothetical protein
MKNQTNLKNPETEDVQASQTLALGSDERCVSAREERVVFYVVQERGGQSIWGEWGEGNIEDSEINPEDLLGVMITKVENTGKKILFFGVKYEEYAVDSNTLPLELREVK